MAYKSANRSKGYLGEKIALNFLLKKSFKFIEKNFYCLLGEIDLIMKKNNVFHFVEVKAKIGTKRGQPYEAVNKKKIYHLKKAIKFYILKNGLENYKLSLDVVSIVLNQDLSLKNVDFFENITL